MTKQLICLISTKGKTSSQISKEATKAYKKFKKVEAGVLAKIKNKK